MGHKPWDRPWKRADKMRERREWQADAAAQVTGSHPFVGEDICETCGEDWDDPWHQDPGPDAARLSVTVLAQ